MTAMATRRMATTAAPAAARLDGYLPSLVGAHALHLSLLGAIVEGPTIALRRWPGPAARLLLCPRLRLRRHVILTPDGSIDVAIMALLLPAPLLVIIIRQLSEFAGGSSHRLLPLLRRRTGDGDKGISSHGLGALCPPQSLPRQPCRRLGSNLRLLRG